MRRTFALALGLAVLFLLSCPLPAQEPPAGASSIASAAGPSVVRLILRDSAGKEIGSASGFLVSADGKIVTNYHVIQGASEAEVRFLDGATYRVLGVMAMDPDRDLAVLKLVTIRRDFAFLRLADSDKVVTGERVVAVGSPAAFWDKSTGLTTEAAVSDGTVSGIRQYDPRKMRILQTTASISGLSSGGALLNLQGEVVGIASNALVSGENQNFAVPANYAAPLLADAPAKPLQPAAIESRAAPPPPNRTPAQMLRSAKSVCVALREGDAVLKTELSGKLVEWGKLRVVAAPTDADLILTVMQTGRLKIGSSNQATAVLTDRASGTELWTTTKGGTLAFSGWSSSWVARALAKDFMKFYEGQGPASTQ